MWWQYLMVFLGTIAVDITPLPLPPAFTVMVFLQIKYNLPIGPVIAIGVAGSILGRLILTLYIPRVASRIFNQAKNEDVQFLGNKLKNEFWKGQFFILFYTLMPLPSTPLFIAGGIAKMKPLYIIPAFVLGKVVSDTAAVFMGKYAAENTGELFHGVLSWKSIAGLVVGLLLIFSILFIDWRTLIQQKKFRLKFNIWK
jgi:membrane protein YqaA with SNARE-associated domain